jgi:hypothetical protein
MKNLITLLALFFVMETVTGQENVQVFVNNTLAGTVSSRSTDPAVITLKKIKPALLTSVSVQITGPSMEAVVYKKTVVATAGTTLLQTAEESKTKKASFIFTDKKLLQQLAAGKKILLELQLHPADERLMIQSKMLPLCYIVM